MIVKNKSARSNGNIVANSFESSQHMENSTPMRLSMAIKRLLSPLNAAFAVSVSAISGALLLQHVWGYQPCVLCLEQRTPYYIALPLVFLAIALKAFRNNMATALSLLLTVVSVVLFAWGLDTAVFHAGAEWHFWAGPQTCGSTAEVANSLDAYIAQLKATPVIDCTKPALVFGGLSLAGWNVVALCMTIGLLLWSAKQTADAILRDLKG
ncbi:disulfide bond formation protein B [Rhizobium sp. MHM7A]|uniref:disulfide bond formation protein B n=1 Tax=Rhizobium sp. MHM7A TaxID=2583233 RepID=UPI001FEF9EBB|nr:disulfide bond formation protein B [Rhizobium sp. MHM7A]